MCGLGAVLLLREGRVTPDALARMAATLSHRGPDGAGFAVLDGGRVGLAHVRLSLVDLGGGAQPIFNEDRSVAVVLNGEIYDHARLREELQRRGHVFRTRTDTEVLVHLYEEHGPDFVRQLEGEFAFVLWDQRKKRLLAARDAAGVKPLFFARAAGEIAFASEAKAILARGTVPRAIAKEYLVGPLFGVSVPGLTPFEGIRALRPGHLLLVSDGQVAEETAWYRPRFEVDRAMTFEDAKAALGATLRRAVHRRLTADVPVHVYLSGGVDSTLMAGLAAEAGHRPTAYTLAFGGTAFDESEAARATARHYGLPFEVVDGRVSGLVDHLARAVYHCESPLGNLNSVAKLRLSAHVRARGIKACLTGEGSDELFGGYAYFKLEALMRMRAQGGAARAEAEAIFARMKAMEGRNEGLMWSRSAARTRTEDLFGFPSYVQRHVDGVSASAMRILSRDLGLPAGRTPASVFRETYADRGLAAMEPFNASRALALDALAGYIIPNLGDRVEMANGLECRTPFLDREVMALAHRMAPEHLLDLRALREKRVLYAAFEDVLPPAVREGRKHPFLSPGWRAFAETRGGDAILSALLSPQAVARAGMFDPKVVALLRGIWSTWPASRPFTKSLDFGVGFLLTMQLVHHLFVEKPIEIPAGFAMEDRTNDPGPPSISAPAITVSPHGAVRVPLPDLAAAARLSEWDRFVLRHRATGNHAVHLVSACWFFGGPVLALVTWNAWFLVPFFLSGALGAAGHAVFHDGGVSVREATAQATVPVFVLRMLWRLFRGTYAADVDAAVARFESSRSAGAGAS